MSSLLHPPRPSIDSVTTIRDDGSRLFLHPAEARGRFTRWRRRTGWLLIAIYLLLPWIPVGGHPAVFLDIGGRRFHLFGLTLAFQDAWLLFFVISGLGFGLFVATAMLGRVWCGWACPQTVFLEHVYRRIERLIEGDAPARRALDRTPWTAGKVLKRGAKQTAFVLVSAAIAHLFLAYFVSIPELWNMMREAPVEHWSAFLFVAVFTGLLYFNYAWFREQLCIVICPYGRMQSALTDEHTMNIGYDVRRGEPRSKIRIKRAERRTEGGRRKTEDGGQRTDDRGRKTDHGARATHAGAIDSEFSILSLAAAAPSSVLGSPSSVGDCVDCLRCVQVCPTGIDIRQGLQLECIGCAACIDACDTVMTKLGRPTGLIRYDSQAVFEGGRRRWWRPRLIVYTALLLAGMAVATLAVSRVRPASFGITRMSGAPYFVSDETVRNQFLVRLVNKLDVEQRFVLELAGAPDALQRTGFEAAVVLKPLDESVVPLVIQVPRADYDGKFHFMVRVQDEARSYALEQNVEFVGPDPALLREEERERHAKP